MENKTQQLSSEIDIRAEKIANLKKEGKVLRMGASIKDGKVSVGMMEVTQDDPLYSIRGGENAKNVFVFIHAPLVFNVTPNDCASLLLKAIATVS